MAFFVFENPISVIIKVESDKLVVVVVLVLLALARIGAAFGSSSRVVKCLVNPTKPGEKYQNDIVKSFG